MTALAIESIGDGPTDLALIHGWGIGAAAWAPLLPALQPRFRLHLVSLPGYPQTGSTAVTRMDKGLQDSHPGNPHEQRLAGQAPPGSPIGAASSPMDAFHSTAEVLAAALPAGCAVCGWSLGGTLALAAHLQAPERFSRLILVGSTPRFTQADDWPHAQIPSVLRFFSDAIAANSGAMLLRFAALLNQGDAHGRGATRQLTELLAHTPLPETPVLMQGLAWLREVDLRAQIDAVRLPVTLIHGEHDTLMPLAAARWLAAHLPDARLDVFPGAAHAPFLNDPARFAELIIDICHASPRR